MQPLPDLELEWDPADANSELIYDFLTGIRATYRLWIFISVVALQFGILALLCGLSNDAANLIGDGWLWKVGAATILLGTVAFYVASSARRRKLWAFRVLLGLTYLGVACLCLAWVVGYSILQNVHQPISIGSIFLLSWILWKAHVGLRAGSKIIQEGGWLSFEECCRCGKIITMSSSPCPNCGARLDSRHPFPVAGAILILVSAVCWLIGFWSVGFALATLWIAPFTFGFAVLGVFFMLLAAVFLAAGVMKFW
jgi:hypothetical protein